MIEKFGNIWDAPRSPRWPVLITTNGAVKTNGECVMGRGIAREIRDSDRRFAFDLGQLISKHGNRPFRVREDIWSFPVKHVWNQMADPKLIEQSFDSLFLMVMKFELSGLHLPRPGCGNGGLDWEDVRPAVESFSAGLAGVEVWVWGRENERPPEGGL